MAFLIHFAEMSAQMLASWIRYTESLCGVGFLFGV